MRTFGVLLVLLTPHPALPAAAWEVRGYTCTNIMGGNPFRLTIFADDTYITAPFAGTSLPSGMDGGTLEMTEIGSYYRILSGPLLDELKIDTVHIMSPTALTPSGETGLFDCTKAK
jgi:hypothetical protein